MSTSVRSFSYSSRGQRIAGHVFLVAGALGLLLALSGTRWLGVERAATDTALRITAGIAGIVFVGVGLLLAFLDREVVVDRSAGVLALGWTWLRWKRMRVLLLEADAHVELSSKEVQTGRSRTTFYPVSYVHAAGAEEVVSVSDRVLARRRAEALARALALHLVDRTSGTRVTRAPADLDRSAADPATLPPGLTWPRLPQGTRMRARYEHDTLQVTIPPPGFGGGTLFALALLGFAGYLAWLFVTVTIPQLDGLGGVLIGLVLAGLILLFGFGGVYGFVDTVLRTQRLHVSARGIGLRRGRAARADRLHAAEAIEEVVLSEDREGVLARTDERDICLAAHLTSEEADCLRDMVHLALAGRRPKRPR